MEEVRFLYSVYPKKPIKGILENGRPINSGKSLSLTIDQVRKCMECGTVYRWFANEDKLIKVTSLNIERLHNEKLISEEEFKSNKNDVAPVVEEVKVEEPAPIIEETIVEEVIAPAVDEAPVEEVKEEVVEEIVEEKVDETPAVEETVVEEVANESPIVEETVEEVVVEEKKEEAPRVENTFQSNNYKKKKH